CRVSAMWTMSHGRSGAKCGFASARASAPSLARRHTAPLFEHVHSPTAIKHIHPFLPLSRSSPLTLLLLQPYTRLLCPAQYCSRKANFCTFPVAVLGRTATNSTDLGALK